MSATARVLDFPERETFDLNATIREALRAADEADPHAIAREVADAVPENELRGIVRELIGERVTAIVRDSRRRTGRTSPRSARWSAVAERAEEIDIFRQRVCPGGVWKFLGECTAEDVAALADEHLRIAFDNEARAARYDALRKLMDRRRAALVSELTPSSVAKALS